MAFVFTECDFIPVCFMFLHSLILILFLRVSHNIYFWGCAGISERSTVTVKAMEISICRWSGESRMQSLNMKWRAEDPQETHKCHNRVGHWNPMGERSCPKIFSISKPILGISESPLSQDSMMTSWLVTSVLENADSVCQEWLKISKNLMEFWLVKVDSSFRIHNTFCEMDGGEIHLKTALRWFSGLAKGSLIDGFY